MNVADRYYVDVEGTKDNSGLDIPGTSRYGIRDSVTKVFDPRPTFTRSEVHHEVEQLNGRAPPASNASRGKLLSPMRRVKSDHPSQLSPLEWVELLMRVTETQAVLQEAKVSRRKLSPKDVRVLMTHEALFASEWLQLPTAAHQARVAAGKWKPPPRKAMIENLRARRTVEAREAQQLQILRCKQRTAGEEAEDAERVLIDAVSQQLKRVLGIERTNWRASKKVRPV